MAIYVIAQGRIENREMLDQYVSGVLPTISAHGGRVIAFDEAPEIVEGEVAHPRTVILEVPDHATFRGWYDSDEYQRIISLRLESTPGTLVVVKGLPS